MKHPALLLIVAALACDTGNGVERTVTDTVQDRAIVMPAHADAGAADVARNHDVVLAELDAKLGLSADQSARVRDIIARHHAGSDAAWEQVHANHHRAMQEAWTEIETVLDSAQIERLHAWLAVRHGPTSRHAPGQPH